VETLRGSAVSPGIAIGPIFLIQPQGARIVRKFLMPDEVGHEVERFDRALARARAEIDRLGEHVRGKLGEEYKVSEIFMVHLAILQDPKLRRQVVALINNRHFTAEHAVSEILRRYGKSLEEAGDSYLQQRGKDFEDIEHRLQRNLAGQTPEEAARLQTPSVVVAHDLMPSQTVAFDKEKVLGIATEAGGRTSHTAILARALGIPAVVGVAGLRSAALPGGVAIVDGTQGIVIAAPDEATLERYRARSRTIEGIEERTAAEVGRLPAVTRDGRRLTLEANIEFPEEVPTIFQHGAEGVGLYRTEFLYHTAENPPDEDAHFQAYMEAIRALNGRRLTVRVLDLGADKFPNAFPERNPFLGCRSMRLMRLYPQVFRSQLRALLRASALGKVRLMFPMIANLDEFREARNMVREVTAEFDASGEAYDKSMPVGSMIEVPSAAVIADDLAREADFFSLGTNDLVQYTLAVDRDNEHVAHLYSALDPAVLRLIRRTLDEGRKAGIEVSMCGEMAGDINNTILLVGLGFESLSMAPSVIPDIKKLIRSIAWEDARRIAEKALAMHSAREIEAFLVAETRRAVPDLFA